MPDVAETLRAARPWACYDCGKCTATCPVARAGATYSPRRRVLAANAAGRLASPDNDDLFVCLTCGQCDDRCPAEVKYTQLVRTLRQHAYREKTEPDCPHGGALQSLMRMMARGGTRQERLDWIGDDLRTHPSEGEVFYWTGCTMYFDAFFSSLELATLEQSRAAVKLMNRAGVTPVVSPEERCCGHDLLWNGDRESFEALARHNVKVVADSGASTVVTSCAECLRTWKLDYAPFIEGRGPRVVHISEFLAEHSERLGLTGNGRRKITFQDPCRLGRHLGIYDPPREMLASIPGVEIVEMRRNRSRATCCAGGTWTHCDRFAKKIQVDRLREARATGADVLVTACPKCRIHLRCAMKDPNLEGEIEIDMRDVAELAADALE